MRVFTRSDNKFVEDEGWHSACERYEKFIEEHKGQRILFLELGVGFNTPVIIKYPFMRMSLKNKNAFYACINKGQAYLPQALEGRGMALNEDIKAVLDAFISPH